MNAQLLRNFQSCQSRPKRLGLHAARRTPARQAAAPDAAMPPKVVRQWKPSGAKLESNPDVEQLREILNDIRSQPGVEESKCVHACV